MITNLYIFSNINLINLPLAQLEVSNFNLVDTLLLLVILINNYSIYILDSFLISTFLGILFMGVVKSSQQNFYNLHKVITGTASSFAIAN
jgi:hypothetical protein